MKQELPGLAHTNRILISLFALMFSLVVDAQLSDAFKYQTVVRNNSGQAIANQSMSFRISIRTGDPQGNMIYSELQAAITTDAGIANLLVGTGQVITGNFSQIDWSSGDYYLQIEVDPSGGSNYSNMGTSVLASVPFALYSRSSAGTSLWSGDSHSVYFNGSVGVNGPVYQETLSMDTTLFEVHDRFGYPILSITESGIRMYIKSGSKSSKGGFQVYASAGQKISPQCLMSLTGDSIRFYIRDTTDLGGRGGFKVQEFFLGGKGIKSGSLITGTNANQVSEQDKITRLENVATELQIRIMELEKQNRSLLEQMELLKAIVDTKNAPNKQK